MSKRSKKRGHSAGVTQVAPVPRAKYLGRDVVKVQLLATAEDQGAAEKHEALAAYDEAFQRGVDLEIALDDEENCWNENHDPFRV